MDKKPEYWLMDGRARFNIDDAIIFSVEDSFQEAKDWAWSYGDDTVIVKNGKEIVN